MVTINQRSSSVSTYARARQRYSFIWRDGGFKRIHTRELEVGTGKCLIQNFKHDQLRRYMGKDLLSKYFLLCSINFGKQRSSQQRLFPIKYAAGDFYNTFKLVQPIVQSLNLSDLRLIFVVELCFYFFVRRRDITFIFLREICYKLKKVHLTTRDVPTSHYKKIIFIVCFSFTIIISSSTPSFS